MDFGDHIHKLVNKKRKAWKPKGKRKPFYVLASAYVGGEARRLKIIGTTPDSITAHVGLTASVGFDELPEEINPDLISRFKFVEEEQPNA